MSSEDVMRHKTRKLVYNYISKHPGSTFGSMQEVFDLTEGTLRYHLNHLERHRKIHSKAVGKKRGYYPTREKVGSSRGMRDEELEALTDSQQQVLKLIQKNPGITVSEMEKYTTIKRRAIQENVRRLRELQIVWRVGNGRRTGYEEVSQEKLENEMLRLLVVRFLKGEIDEGTYVGLRREIEGRMG